MGLSGGYRGGAGQADGFLRAPAILVGVGAFDLFLGVLFLIAWRRTSAVHNPRHGISF